MKNFKLIIVLVIVASLASCGDKRTPQMQYMPDMYESIPYNADAENGLKGNPVNSKPVAGTIPNTVLLVMVKKEMEMDIYPKQRNS